MKKSKAALKRRLNYHYKYFDKSKISPDPLEFPHRYKDPRDIEISAFISSIFAYGNIKQIIKSLNTVHNVMENQPFNFVLNFSYDEDKEKFKNIKHRFYTDGDIAVLFFILNKVYEVYGSLKYLFLLYYFDSDKNLKNTISFFSNNLLDIGASKAKISGGLKFMFPDPFKKSACKRINLFLRWMVRKDELDFGLWKEIPTDKIIIPVDTHVARICRELNLTKQKNISWKMAEEITEKLKLFDREDPVKYDFAICHIGMRKMEL